MLLLAAVCFWGPYEPASNHNSVQQMPYTVGRGDDDDIGRPATRASVVLPVQMQGFLKDSGIPGAFWSEGPTWKELLQRI